MIIIMIIIIIIVILICCHFDTAGEGDIYIVCVCLAEELST